LDKNFYQHEALKGLTINCLCSFCSFILRALCVLSRLGSYS